MADNYARVIATVATTATTGTDALILKGCNVDQRNFFDISVDITTDGGSGTVQLQRKRQTDIVWRVIESYTANTEKIGEIHGKWMVRLMVTAHGGSGDILLELAQA